MTDINVIALDFCRECLGWEDVREDGIGLYVYSHSERPKKLLHYGDLNSVMAAMRGWLDEQSQEWLMITMTTAKGWKVQFYGVEAVHPNLCYALLSACVKENRKRSAA